MVNHRERRREKLKYKLKFQFDDYKGYAVITLLKEESLNELKHDLDLGKYLLNAEESTLEFSTFQKYNEKRYHLVLYKNKNTRLTIEGSFNSTHDLGMNLVKAELLQLKEQKPVMQAQQLSFL